MSHKITVIELWNNPEWSFNRFVRNLNGRLLGNTDTGEVHNWANVAIRIAVFVGVFAKVMRSELVGGGNTVDLSVVSGDFATPIAAWYARKMGLPIGNIICSCNENSEIWELLHHGEANCSTRIRSTTTPKCDVSIPPNVERLVYETLGEDGVEAFSHAMASRGVYSLDEAQREALSNGLFGAVVGQNRIESIIRNVYITKTYALSPFSALAYGGLQDYRATKGESRHALILTEDGPLSSAELVAKSIGITKETLRERLGAV
jgi:threonine synthase